MWQPLPLQSLLKHVRLQRKVWLFAVWLRARLWHQQLVTSTHTPNQRRAPRRVPELSCGWQLAHSPTALHPLAESPFLSHLDIAHLPGPQLSTYETFYPFLEAHLQVSPAAPPEPQQGALCYNFCSRTLRPIPGIRPLFSDSEQPSRKVMKNYRDPPPCAVSEEAVEAASSAACRLAGESGRWQGSESPAR